MEHVALLQHLADLGLAHALGFLGDHGVMDVRVERLVLDLDGPDASLEEGALEHPVDQLDAVAKALPVGGRVRGAEGPFEVVQDPEELEQELAQGELGVLGLLALDPLPQVVHIGHSPEVLVPDLVSLLPELAHLGVPLAGLEVPAFVVRRCGGLARSRHGRGCARRDPGPRRPLLLRGFLRDIFDLFGFLVVFGIVHSETS